MYGKPSITSNSDTAELFLGDTFTACFSDGSTTTGTIEAFDTDGDERGSYYTASGRLADGRVFNIGRDGSGSIETLHLNDGHRITRIDFDVLADASLLND
jgi:hypothetical protein